jgi:hypothetical protein
MTRERFDPSLLDPNDPFELDDGNRAHLAKHAPFTEDDVIETWSDAEAIFVPAADDAPADWLLIARLAGGPIVQVPLAPSASGDWRRCRPIGIYEAARWQIDEYHEVNG